MSLLFRVGFGRVVNSPNLKNFLNAKNVENIGIRCISGRTMRGDTPRVAKKAPFDYEHKYYNNFKYFIDKTTGRFDENTKILVVEGPVAAGKSKFAKALAEELEMFYMPEANLDMLYTNEYGYNLKKLDEQAPEACRSFDINNFLMNPKHRLSASFQLKQYCVKFSQYIDAIAYMLNTGQGVILDRSLFSDFVFAEAMYQQGYISKGARSVYYEVRNNSITEVLRPHLVIYLDVPVPKILDNIKKRNITYEVNSPVLNADYLQVMECNYKQKYLKEISKHSELLVFDWSEGGDAEVVVEDIEKIVFKYDDQDPKMKDWDLPLEDDWAVLRHKTSDKKNELLLNLRVPRFDVPELVTDADDALAYTQLVETAPGQEYEKGFNKNMGDRGIWTKTLNKFRNTLPLIERSIPV